MTGVVFVLTQEDVDENLSHAFRLHFGKFNANFFFMLTLMKYPRPFNCSQNVAKED